MAEPSLDLLERSPGDRRQRARKMPQIVKPHRGELRLVASVVPYPGPARRARYVTGPFHREQQSIGFRVNVRVEMVQDLIDEARWDGYSPLRRVGLEFR